MAVVLHLGDRKDHGTRIDGATSLLEVVEKDFVHQMGWEVETDLDCIHGWNTNFALVRDVCCFYSHRLHLS